jgi:hypothetical protein
MFNDDLGEDQHEICFPRRSRPTENFRRRTGVRAAFGRGRNHSFGVWGGRVLKISDCVVRAPLTAATCITGAQ